MSQTQPIDSVMRQGYHTVQAQKFFSTIWNDKKRIFGVVSSDTFSYKATSFWLCEELLWAFPPVTMVFISTDSKEMSPCTMSSQNSLNTLFYLRSLNCRAQTRTEEMSETEATAIHSKVMNHGSGKSIRRAQMQVDSRRGIFTIWGVY